MMRLGALKCFSIIVLFSAIFVACSIEAEPINYGKDACSYCMMNIVDRQYAAEIVTKKGKVFKYDAIECMIRDIKNRHADEVALFLITDYAAPGKFVEAKTATFLISEKLQSPMGANLTGFEKLSDAEKIQREKLGTLYAWNAVKNLF